MNWLRAFLDDAVRRRLCCRIGCTTCGAMDFRRGVVRAASAATGAPDAWPMQGPTAKAIATALGQMESPGRPVPYDFVYAVRLLICDLDWVLGRDELREALGASWASGKLVEMEHHHAEREAARRAYEMQNDPAIRERNRESKRRARAEKHATRLAVKAERDRVWRASRGMDTGGLSRP